jgi:hypothetical protein
MENTTGADRCDAVAHKRELLPARRDWGKKRACRPRPEFIVEAGQAGQAEALAPLADDLAWAVETRGNYIIGETLAASRDDLGTDDITIR